MKSLGILGFGSFGRFMAAHLKPHFQLHVCDRQDVREAASRLGVAVVDVEEVVTKDVLVLAVPVQSLDAVLRETHALIRPSTLVIDVCSVKVKPLELLERHLDPAVEAVGTHPMFGPQSGRDGIEGLKIVLCPLRARRLAPLRDFLHRDLGLCVLEMTPQRHDAEMAYIQGLTHWIAKALREIKVPDLELSTPAYRHLLKIEEILREDSLDLFMTIQRENPYAQAARSELLHRLEEIEEWIVGEA